MFSSALSVGTRLKDWKTNPTCSRRTLVRALSSSVVRSVPSMKTCPAVTSSRPATQCMRVDLPEPDGPMIAVNRPAWKFTETPSRARTSVSPWP